MNNPTSSATNWEAQNKRNTKTLAAWTIAWTLSMALATFGPLLIWHGERTLTLVGILLNFAIVIGMIWANKKYLQGQDELQQKIQFEAMALALGVGVVGGLSYSLLDITDVIPVDAEISFLVMAISITYLVAIAIGRKRYL